MLKFENKEDIYLMMNYHRTRDMLNLIKYFPNVSPVRDLTLILTLEEYFDNYEFCNSFAGSRNDTIMTKPSMVSVEVKVLNRDLTVMFKKIKELYSEGFLILFNVLNVPSERYDRYAGISVGVSLGNFVYIEAVGQGFDGREVTKEICTHERYTIPWYQLRKCNINNFKSFRTYLISQEDYLKTRRERVNFLRNINLEDIEIDKHVPLKYKEIPDFIWEDVIINILKKLIKMEDELRSDGLEEFAISGHTEGRRFRPWQMFDKKRYVL